MKELEIVWDGALVGQRGLLISGQKAVGSDRDCS